jgi:arylsulfatase A-like enzyme
MRGVLPSETSLPRLLKSAGYATGLVGKWHLGWKPEFHPNRHGFDEFWGFLGGYVDYYSNVGEFERHDLFHDDRAVRDSLYLTDEITARATAFIDAHSRAPFFLEVAYNATHWPFERPGLDAAARRRFDPKSRDGTRADYVEMLESADRGVGAILAALDRLNLSRNTLVVFTSDNGGEWLSRNAPLFHRKSTLWEGGIRVPLLLRWPARLPAGVETRQVGITMDLTASILAAAGVRAPTSPRPDGVDLLPLLERPERTERTLFWRIQSPGRAQRAVRRGRWKYLRDGGQEFLFDLDRDVGERRDLTPTHAAMLPELRKLLAAWEADVDAGRSPPRPSAAP